MVVVKGEPVTGGDAGGGKGDINGRYGGGGGPGREVIIMHRGIL